MIFLLTTSYQIKINTTIILFQLQFEFIRGLLKVAMEKMEHSISQLLPDDTLFSHFVDETLLFDQEIHNLYEYSSNDHQCLKVLTTPECLSKWVELESQCKEMLN